MGPSIISVAGERVRQAWAALPAPEFGIALSLQGLRMGGLVVAAAGVPWWEYALLLGVLLLLSLCAALGLHPLRCLVGDAPVLAHHPASRVARHALPSSTLPSFLPTFWLCSPHFQTMFLHFFARAPKVAYMRQLLVADDGGTLGLDWLHPKGNEKIIVGRAGGAERKEEGAEGQGRPHADSTPIAIVIPGLTSDSQSQYVRHCAADIAALGWRVLVLNHRGLGGVKITSEKLYNAGWTDDLEYVLSCLRHSFPSAPLYALGTSMGANILVKYLGEAGASTPIQAACVIGCPWDLVICDRWMNRNLLQRLYNTAMAFGLKSYALMHKDSFEKTVGMKKLTKSRSIREFDDHVTRVMANYETVDTYYRSCSSAQFLPGVGVPLLCISALDDPICTKEALPWAEARMNPNVVLAVTRHGGHLAYFEGLTASRIWWSRVAAAFLLCMSQQPTPLPHEASNRRVAEEAVLCLGPGRRRASTTWRGSGEGLDTAGGEAGSRDGARQLGEASSVGVGQERAQHAAVGGNGGNKGSAALFELESGPRGSEEAEQAEAQSKGRGWQVEETAAVKEVVSRGEEPTGTEDTEAGGHSSRYAVLTLSATPSSLLLLEDLLLQLLSALQKQKVLLGVGAAPTPSHPSASRPSAQAPGLPPIPHSQGSPLGSAQKPLELPAVQREGIVSALHQVPRESSEQRQRTPGLSSTTSLLLLHGAIAIAGPIVACAIALRLQRSSSFLHYGYHH